MSLAMIIYDLVNDAEHLHGYDKTVRRNKAILDIKSEIKAKMPKKDSVPKYSKGSSGETLKLLQMGYNLYADEMEKVIDEM